MTTPQPQGFTFHRSRQVAIGHHFDQATRWLNAATSPEDTTALTYCAFELRLEIERIAIEYFKGINGGKVSSSDLRYLTSFKSLENRIYEKDGHQRDIDRKLEFLEIIFSTLEVPIQVVRPNFGRLADMWHRCSEYCHVLWSMGAGHKPQEVWPAAVAELRGIADALRPFMSSSLAWPGALSPEFEAIKNGYVRGELSRDQVVAEIRRQGIWGSLEMPGSAPTEFRLKDEAEDGTPTNA